MINRAGNSELNSTEWHEFAIKKEIGYHVRLLRTSYETDGWETVGPFIKRPFSNRISYETNGLETVRPFIKRLT